MPDRQAVADDIARTVHALDALVRRLGIYQKNLPDLISAERNDLMKSALALLTIINAIMEEPT